MRTTWYSRQKRHWKKPGDKISDSEKTTVQADITKVKEILDRTTPDNMTDADVSEINEAKEQLMKDAQTLFAKMYEQAQQGAQGGPQAAPGGDANSTYNADDVVDADYKEV